MIDPTRRHRARPGTTPRRTVTGTAVFVRPFLLRTIGRELPAGSYAIENEEETLQSGGYQRVEIRLIIPSVFGGAEAETWILGPAEMDEALRLDRQPANRPEARVPRSAASAVQTANAAGRLQVRKRNSLQDKGVNTPLYGALLGVLALLLAAAVLGRVL